MHEQHSDDRIEYELGQSTGHVVVGRHGVFQAVELDGSHLEGVSARHLARWITEAINRATDQEASDLWDKAYSALEGTRMDSLTLGFVGKMEGVPDRYNEALDIILDKLEEGQKSIHGAASELDAVAKHYAQLDYEYYKKFGYMLK